MPQPSSPGKSQTAKGVPDVPQAQIVTTFSERGFACLAVRVDEGNRDASGRAVGTEYIGRVPMRVPIGVRPATGEPVPWGVLTEDEQADPVNASGPRLWAQMTNTQKKAALVAAATAERNRSIAPAPEDPGVTGMTGTVTI